MQQWLMPEWMQKYRNYVTNLRGLTIESYMTGHTVHPENAPLVKSQILLLENLHNAGLLRDIAE
jgi:hypothetical protein